MAIKGTITAPRTVIRRDIVQSTLVMIIACRRIITTTSQTTTGSTCMATILISSKIRVRAKILLVIFGIVCLVAYVVAIMLIVV